jgi:hypothetical protein
MQRIEADAGLSQKQKALQIEHEQLMIETARLELEEAREAGRRAREKHELEMRHQQEELQRHQSANRHEQDAATKLHTAKQWLPWLDAQLAERIADLNSSDPRLAYQAREFLTQLFGVKPQMLQSAGYDARVQSALQQLLARQQRDGNPVRLEKPEIITRDMGLRQDNVLKIGSTLSFTLHSARPGYVTLINFGTSGRLWLLCPGSLCPAEHTHIEANRPYPIPGPILFPVKQELFEKGPGGWEHLVAVISDRPLIGPGLAVPTPLAKPLNELSAEAMGRLMAELDGMPGAWTAGVLSFEVEA